MSSKERVRAAIAHRQPDRVPMGELEIDAPIVEAVLGRPTFYRAQFRAVKAYWEGRRDEVVESMKRDYIEFIRQTGHDIARVDLVPDRDAEIFPMEPIGESDYRDLNGNVFRYSEETGELMLFHRGAGPPKMVAPGGGGSPYEPSESELEFARHVIAELGETHFILAPGTLIFPPDLPFRGGRFFDDMLEALIERPERYRDQLLQGAPVAGRLAEFAKRLGCDAICLALDIGTNKGTFMSPRSHREVFLPSMKAKAERAHAHGMPLVWHACGNNRLVWDQFAESGIDVYQAIQEEEPIADLKRLHGDRLALWGGVSCRTLDAGTPAQVREQARHAIEAAAPGGGFLLGSSHSLGIGVKYENYMAMLETWHALRGA
ncbi:MAG: hypothetical protein NTW86_22770 [Candidatus Sumerlaeota bacterium]|nr:hypothetical protein [Candidatus Sumerlaeota bacterium]